MKRGPKPTVEYEGRTYTCRAWKIEIPDLDSMERLHALLWIMQNTIPTGWSRPKPRLPIVNLVVS